MRSALFPVTRVVGRLVLRSPLVLTLCLVCLTAGVVEVSLMQALHAALSRQLDYRGLGTVQLALRSGAASEQASALDPEEIAELQALCATRGCAVAPQVVTSALSPQAGRPPGGVTVRGLADGFTLPGVSIERTAGRAPAPGRPELLIGEDLRRDQGLSVGDHLTVDGRSFLLVGEFRATGAPLGREALGHADQLRSINQPGFNSAWIGPSRLGSGLSAADVQEAFHGSVEVVNARDHFAKQFRKLRLTVERFVTLVSGLVVAFVVTAYASSVGGVVRRAADAVAILHALGFSRGHALAGLTAVGGALGLGAGLLATGLTMVFARGWQITLPAGFQSMTLALEPSVGATAIAVAAATLLGATGAAVAGYHPLGREART